MNLKQLLKRMVAIKDRQQTINKKFSSRGKTAYIHQADLKRDQQEDIRIFGFTNAQTIYYFRNKSKEPSNKPISKCLQPESAIQKDDFDENQIEKIFKRRTRTVQEKRRKNLATASISRPQTFNLSAKTPQTKTKYLNSAHQRNSALTFHKSSKSTVVSGDTLKFQRTIDDFQGKVSHKSFMVYKKLEPDQISPTSLHSRHSNDLNRQQFTRQFQTNIKYLKQSSRQQRDKFRKNTMVYDVNTHKQKRLLIKKSIICNSLPNQINLKRNNIKKVHKSNIFELTSQLASYYQQQSFKQKIYLKEDLLLLRGLSPLLIKKTINMLPINRRLCGVHRWLPVWRPDIFSALKGKFNILIVQTKSLKSLLIEDVQQNKLGLVCKNAVGQLNLQEIIKNILKLNPGHFVHFIVFQGNNLAHEEFLINGDLYVRQSKQHQSLITQYFLKRYLCQDLSIDSIDQVLKNTQMIVGDEHIIPEQFEEFVTNFPERVVYFYDRKSKLLQCSLNKVLYGGLQHLHCKLTINKETKGLRKVALKSAFSASYYNSHYFYI